MRVVTVCKANPIGVREVESVRLDIAATLPEPTGPIGESWERDAVRFYDEQARQIVTALDALPQGTRHQLLRLLLTSHLNLFQGPMPQDGGR